MRVLADIWAESAVGLPPIEGPVTSAEYYVGEDRTAPWPKSMIQQ